MNDNGIIELFYSRDDSAILELESAYGAKMKNSARRYLSDKRDVEEVYNDTLITLWESIPPERPKKLGAYVTTVIKRKVIDKLRYIASKKRSPNEEVILSEFDEILNYAGSSQSAEDTVIDNDSDIINEFLKTETAAGRRIFVKRYYFGKSISEIAKESGMTESAVYTRISRIKSRLYDYLIGKGYLL